MNKSEKALIEHLSQQYPSSDFDDTLTELIEDMLWQHKFELYVLLGCIILFTLGYAIIAIAIIKSKL